MNPVKTTGGTQVPAQSGMLYPEELRVTVPPQPYTGDYMTGRVYFISDGELIKIGYSGAPEIRLTSLQSHNGKRLEILKTIPGTVDDEKSLHKKFAHLRVRGEWFRPAPELTALIVGQAIEPTPFDDDELRKLKAWSKTTSVHGARMYVGTIISCIREIKENGPNKEQCRLSLELAVEALAASKEGRPLSQRYHDIMKAGWPPRRVA